MTMELVSTVTVGAGGAASIEFTGIPQTGQDLMVVLSARTAYGSAQDQALIRFNESSIGYSSKWILGTGSSASSLSNYLDTASLAPLVVGNTATASTFGNTQMYISNYAGSTNKSHSVDNVNETNATAAYMSIIAGLWSNTAAITSIGITANSATNFVQYSTASLYTISTSGATGASVA